MITNDFEIVGGVEEDASSAFVVAAPVLLPEPHHVGLAEAEAVTIYGDRVMLCFCRVLFENDERN